MSPITRQNLSSAIAELLPRIIQGVQLEFLVKRTITYTQFLILVAIHSLKSCPMSVLAKSMHVSMPTISGIVDRLVQGGYVKRAQSLKDRRQVMIELSYKGEMLIVQFQGVVGQRWNEVLKNLSSKDVESFFKIIQKLQSELKNQNANFKK